VVKSKFQLRRKRMEDEVEVDVCRSTKVEEERGELKRRGSK